MEKWRERARVTSSGAEVLKEEGLLLAMPRKDSTPSTTAGE